MQRVLLNIVLTLSLIQICLGAYNCPNTCVLPKCQCAKVTNPGGIANNQSPQFVVLSFDDDISTTSQAAVQPLLDRLKASAAVDSAGCKPKTIFFFLTANSDYHLITNMVAQHPVEIAIHTLTHTTGKASTLDTWEKEIPGCRNFTERLAMIPRSQLSGFRFPFLEFNNEGLQVLNEHGFLYDSSIFDYWGGDSLGLSNQGSMYFPFTLDFGSPLDIYAGGPTQVNNFPGLWEIPMHDLMTRAGESYSTMDPPGTPEEILQILKDNFLDHYNGNRSPFGIYLHHPWLASNAGYTDMLVEFFEFVGNPTNFPGVFFVDNKQIIQWSQSPFNIATAINKFKCTPPVTPPTSTEICNGVDDNKNGQIDEGTTNTCTYSGQIPFTTCGLCPNTYPGINLDFSVQTPCVANQCIKGTGGNAGQTCVNCPLGCGPCAVPTSTTSSSTTVATTSSTTSSSTTKPSTTSSTTSSTVATTSSTTVATTSSTTSSTVATTASTTKPATTDVGTTSDTNDGGSKTVTDKVPGTSESKRPPIQITGSAGVVEISMKVLVVLVALFFL